MDLTPRRTDPADGATRITPMMEQYIEIKAANPGALLFYRMGDFYELFFGDAEVASRALGIVLTKRGKHQGDDIPMCGVPIARSEEYLHRLIALGHRVAVCEQTEDPAEARKRGAKSVVRRAVVRLVTPGTITEETLLEPTRPNLLLAVARLRLGHGAGLRARRRRHLDGPVRASANATRPGSPRRSPASIRARSSWRKALREDAGSRRALARACGLRHARGPRPFRRRASAERRLAAFFGLADDRRPRTLWRAPRRSRRRRPSAMSSARRSGSGRRSSRRAATPPRPIMAIDAATRANLEHRPHARRRAPRLASRRDRPHHHGGRQPPPRPSGWRVP